MPVLCAVLAAYGVAALAGAPSPAREWVALAAAGGQQAPGPPTRPTGGRPRTGRGRAERRTRKGGPRGPRPVQLSLAHHLGHGATFRVTMAPVGLSFEYPVLASALGSGPCPPPALVDALRGLGSPPLRLGGNSQDLTVPSGALAGMTPTWLTATLYTLPAPFWSQLHCLLAATHEPLEVGVNGKLGGPQWAEAIAAGARAAATDGLEFSLGNEPDLYYLPNYASLGSHAHYEAAAAALYLAVSAPLRAALAGAPLIGPELARPQSWRRELASITAGLGFGAVGVHLYPLSWCGGPAPTVAQLLSPAAVEAPRTLSWVASEAAAEQLPAIITEANSVACGGVHGVSDAPAAGVWAAGFVLNALESGFREVRFHFSGGYYDPFLVRGGTVIDRPIESVLAALNHWLPVGSDLQLIPGLGGLLGTEITGPPGSARLVLENLGTIPRPLVLKTASAVRVAWIYGTRAGVAPAMLTPRGGLARVSMPAGSALVVLA